MLFKAVHKLLTTQLNNFLYTAVSLKGKQKLFITDMPSQCYFLQQGRPTRGPQGIFIQMLF